MNILQCIRLRIKHSNTQITHNNTFHPLRYVHLRYAFTYIQKQYIAYFLRKIQTLQAINLRNLRIQNVNYSGYYFYMNTNLWRDFQICISFPLVLKKVHPN